MKSILPESSALFYTNSHLLMEFTVESNKERFLGNYIEELAKNDVYILLITQEGNSSYYLQNFSDFHIIVIELTVLESSSSNFEFQKFGQIPMNENKILFSINNVLHELKDKTVLIIFDSISDIILWLDFNVAYKFMRKAISNLRRDKTVSSFFLINKRSHSEQILAAFESLFDGVIVTDAVNECQAKGVIKYRYISY